MSKIYGYCRVSTKHQHMQRQITNIKEIYPNAIIIKEFFTGTTSSRPEWEKLCKLVNEGDIIIMDSVSRMSRNASEGFADYTKLYSKNVILEFIKEPHINTSVFKNSSKNIIDITVNTGNKAVDEYFKGNMELVNKLLMQLAEQQIYLAFEQSQKEVDDLHNRISEGMRESKKNGIQIGLPKGTKLITKSSIKCKEIIMKHSVTFGGTLKDAEVIKLCGCSRNSFYKYKNELKLNNK